jgi:hypothetical protein
VAADLLVVCTNLYQRDDAREAKFVVSKKIDKAEALGAAAS